MLTVRTFSGLGELKEHREQWDALAVAASRPLAAPAVVGAWWERLRPPKASLQVITVWDDATVVGILPLVREGHLYSWPGGHVMTVEPLARPGMEDDIAAAIARGLADLRPGPYRIELELQGDSPQWATLLSRAWPGRWDLRDRQV